MKRIILLINFFVLIIAQSQPFSGRIYEIPINHGHWESTTIHLNEITGGDQNYYRLTFFDIVPNEPYPEGITGCEGFFNPEQDNYSWSPGSVSLGMNNNEHYGISDPIMMINAEDPTIRLDFSGCHISTGGYYSSTSTLIMLIESDFPDQDGYGADWNNDGDINIIDIVAIIDYILFGEV